VKIEWACPICQQEFVHVYQPDHDEGYFAMCPLCEVEAYDIIGILEAQYMALVGCHDGGRLYEVLSKLLENFKPSPTLCIDGFDEWQKEMYVMYCEKYLGTNRSLPQVAKEWAEARGWPIRPQSTGEWEKMYQAWLDRGVQ